MFSFASRNLRKILKKQCHGTRTMSNISTEPPTKTEQMFNILGGGSVDLELNKDEGIAVMTLNYPQKKNSLTGKMMADLEKNVFVLEKWKDGWGLILRGEGETFCSGGNLQFMKLLIEKKDEGYPEVMSEHMQMTLDRLQNLSLLSTAILEGPTLGGGAELATSCDFRIMSDTASLSFLHGQVGLCTGWGGSARLVKLVGYKTALRLIASGTIMKADEALSLGLVDGKFPAKKNSVVEGFAFLKNISKIAPEVMKGNKRVLLNASKLATYSEVYEVERNVFQSLFGGPAHLKSFIKS